MHTAVAVILDAGWTLEDDVAACAAAAEEFIERFNYELEVAEHRTECGCLWMQRWRSGHALVEDVLRIVEIRERLSAVTGDDRGLYQAAWTPFINGYGQLEDAVKDCVVHRPDPGCADCKGTGFITSHANPDAHWDWFQLGGRWGGVMVHGYLPRETSEDDVPRELYNNDPVHNVCRVADIHPSFVPGVIVTPEGEWADEPRHVADLYWDKMFALYKRIYAEHMAVLIDCHY